ERNDSLAESTAIRPPIELSAYTVRSQWQPSWPGSAFRDCARRAHVERKVALRSADRDADDLFCNASKAERHGLVLGCGQHIGTCLGHGVLEPDFDAGNCDVPIPRLTDPMAV